MCVNTMAAILEDTHKDTRTQTKTHITTKGHTDTMTPTETREHTKYTRTHKHIEIHINARTHTKGTNRVFSTYSNIGPRLLFPHHIWQFEALTCSRREDGLSRRHGVKPPLTHSLTHSLTIGYLFVCRIFTYLWCDRVHDPFFVFYHRCTCIQVA